MTNHQMQFAYYVFVYDFSCMRKPLVVVFLDNAHTFKAILELFLDINYGKILVMHLSRMKFFLRYKVHE